MSPSPGWEFKDKIKDAIKRVFQESFDLIADRLGRGRAEDLRKEITEIPALPGTKLEDIEKWIIDVDSKLAEISDIASLAPVSVTWEKIGKPILNALFPEEGLDPEEAKDAARAHVALGVAAALVGAYISVIGELMSLGQVDGLGEPVKAVINALGLNNFSSGIVSTTYDFAITRPLRYSLNASFRTRVPEWHEALELFGRAHISEDQFKLLMSYHGYNPEWEEAFKKAASRPVSAFLMRYVMEGENVDKDKLLWLFQDAGYDIEKSKFLLSSMLEYTLSRYRRAIVQTITDAFTSGYISASDFIAYMENAGLNPDAVNLLVRAAEIEADVKDRKAEAKVYLDELAKGYLTEEEAERLLLSLGLRPEAVKNMIAKARIRTAFNMRKVLEGDIFKPVATILENEYKEGFITREEFIERLRALGIREELIPVYVAKADYKYEYDLKKDLLDAYILAFRRGKLTQEQFYEKMLEIGIVPEKASALLFKEVMRKPEEGG